ncbi:nuclear transport factor 2 family protein [Streptomyces sp. SID10853]|uniref:nuclear transport factor 2 family protein n=1 Tax=Streptomyces sp. SID10853 TaxID=2706028 RepID=UPI0013BEBFD3|nr:nuclear transport factor 2 family protein [Streptomyces sp. SID10853]NDZ78354.1 nuclear transport factor 2 family protein [Streptomyces sp. SID10853]
MPSNSAVPRSPESLAHEVLTRYLELCDVPRPPDTTGRLEDLFTPDAVWEGVGPLYAAKFGRTTGAGAIAAMLSAHLPPNGRFQANVHLLQHGTTHAAYNEVRGKWLMQQLSRYESGAAELVVARLELDFRIEEHSEGDSARDTEGARALISRFRTRRVFDAELGPALVTGLQEVTTR